MFKRNLLAFIIKDGKIEKVLTLSASRRRQAGTPEANLRKFRGNFQALARGNDLQLIPS
jgi:hypothetical protein